MNYPATLDPADRAAWREGELVIGTDGHIVPPPDGWQLEDDDE